MKNKNHRQVPRECEFSGAENNSSLAFDPATNGRTQNKIIFGLIASVFLLSIVSVSAATTQLTVHTLPVHEVSVYILDPGPKYYSLGSFTARTGFDGLVAANVSYITTPEFGLQVIIKKDGKVVFTDRLENQVTQAFVDVYVLINESDNFMTPPVQDSSASATDSSLNNVASGGESAEENNSEVVIVPGVNKGVTGEAVGPNAGITGNLVYIIAIVVVLAISLAGFLFMRQKHSNHPALKSDDSPPTVFLVDKELEEAERKIKYAESQLRIAREANAKRAEAQKKADMRKDFELNSGNSGSLAGSTVPTNSNSPQNNPNNQNNQNPQDNKNNKNKNQGQGNNYSSSVDLDKL